MGGRPGDPTRHRQTAQWGAPTARVRGPSRPRQQRRRRPRRHLIASTGPTRVFSTPGSNGLMVRLLWPSSRSSHHRHQRPARAAGAARMSLSAEVVGTPCERRGEARDEEVGDQRWSTIRAVPTRSSTGSRRDTTSTPRLNSLSPMCSPSSSRRAHDSSNGSSNGWGVTRGYPQVPAIMPFP